jgi:hypothetical protein
VKDEKGQFVNRVADVKIKQQRDEASKKLHTGFVAQDVETAGKKLGYDFSGLDKPKNASDVYGLRYSEFVVPLVKAVQEQQATIEGLEKKIAQLEEMLLKIAAKE